MNVNESAESYTLYMSLNNYFVLDVYIYMQVILLLSFKKIDYDVIMEK